MLLMMAATKIVADSAFSGGDPPVIIPAVQEPLSPVPLPEEGLVSFSIASIADLYTTSAESLQFSYTEKGVAYGQQETSTQTIKCEIPLVVQPVTFQLSLSRARVYRSGINYAGSVLVSHNSGPEFQLLLPGTRTYDPAGVSGDPHCSERVGPSCSSALLKIVYVCLVAAVRGASLDGVKQVFNAFSTINEKYHGRIIIMQYMQHQLDSAVFQLKEPLDYPDFVKEKLAGLELTGDREHTKCYFDSASKNSLLQPPRQYFQKVQTKDVNIAELLSAEDYQRFLKLV